MKAKDLAKILLMTPELDVLVVQNGKPLDVNTVKWIEDKTKWFLLNDTEKIKIKPHSEDRLIITHDKDYKYNH